MNGIAGIGLGVVGTMVVVAPLTARYRLQSRTDPLTGLANRRGLLAALRSQRRRGGGCLVVIDLVGFKGVNEICGHQSGDRFLVAVSRALASRVPAAATVARVGGDEFAALLPATVGLRPRSTDRAESLLRALDRDVRAVAMGLPVAAGVPPPGVGVDGVWVPLADKGARQVPPGRAGGEEDLDRAWRALWELRRGRRSTSS